MAAPYLTPGDFPWQVLIENRLVSFLKLDSTMDQIHSNWTLSLFSLG